MLPEARRILADIEAARTAVGDVGHGLRGTIRIGLMQALPLVDVADILARYHRERPLVQIRPQPAEGGVGRAGRCRAGGRSRRRVRVDARRPHPGLTLTPLAAEPIRLITRPDHPLAGRTSVPVRDLTGEKFVDFPNGFGTRRSVDTEFAKAGAHHRVCVEVPDLSTLTELVRAGLGVATLPCHCYRTEAGWPSSILSPAPTFEVALALPSDRRPSATTTAFLDLVAAMVPIG